MIQAIAISPVTPHRALIKKVDLVCAAHSLYLFGNYHGYLQRQDVFISPIGIFLSRKLAKSTLLDYLAAHNTGREG